MAKRSSFRSKMIMLFGLSMLVSGVITYLLYKVLQYYYRTQVRLEDSLALIRRMIREIGDVNVFLLFFVPLSILFFYLFTKPYDIYFREISTGIHHLANGDFSRKVHIPSNDELGEIAKDINLAGEKLQEAVERGDFAESSKDQLVLNLAHDLRTPLTSVLGYLDFILRDEQLTAEQVRHYATIAFTKSQRLEKLIDELFEITRMKYGKVTIDEKIIDLSELLVQLNEEMYPALEKNNLVARMNVAPQLMIRGDGELLARVFENLLMNACRYGSDGQFVDMNGYRDDGAVVIQIINYGDPIPEEIQAHIFEMFFTGDKARTHQDGSTGLGLFIAKNIVEQHQGTISVQSDLIRTQFEVRLPYESKA
ncbi:HAMP domain-containing histidine kinase [Brevibacillus ruminantium]|uniref:histidine kinase n=1 Tax=Brevibacillus ruminantium TaxID=2950604 RepID=A0ABY4WPR8_9BACL|nr:HAMP domain-containing sensor histidine kinase [Brevibacillus ruminantium]USG67870.1 HAMP domain-containing histidine kinase [Brevibacillus ruminantium]